MDPKDTPPASAENNQVKESYTPEEVAELISARVTEATTPLTEQIGKLQSQVGYNGRKKEDTPPPALNEDEIIAKTSAKVREEMTEQEVLKKYPEADAEELKALKAEHPTLSWDQVVALHGNTKAFGLDGNPARNTVMKKYTNDSFAKLSEADKSRALQEVRDGKATIE